MATEISQCWRCAGHAIIDLSIQEAKVAAKKRKKDAPWADRRYFNTCSQLEIHFPLGYFWEGKKRGDKIDYVGILCIHLRTVYIYIFFSSCLKDGRSRNARLPGKKKKKMFITGALNNKTPNWDNEVFPSF